MLYAAQSFTADAPYVDKVLVKMGKTGSPTDSVVCKIYNNTTSNPGSTLIVTSASVAAADIAANDANGTSETFTFKNTDYSQPLTVGVTYWIVFERTGSTSNSVNYQVHYHAAASMTVSHALSRHNGTSWTADTSGYDLYHIVYAGGVLAKDIKISGGERDIEAVKLIGYNEIREDKRSGVVEVTYTAVYQSGAIHGLAATPAESATGYMRSRGGELSATDRNDYAVGIKLVSGAYEVVLLLNNAVVTMTDFSMAADGSAEQTITAKGLASNYYEEDNYA